MRIKRERKVKWKFVVFPRKCDWCGDIIFMEKMLKDKAPAGCYSMLTDYYCEYCTKKYKSRLLTK